MSDGLPSDLLPLPTAPYSVRPDELPLDIEECRTALWLVRGNVTKAAAKLKVAPSRLRRFIAANNYLRAEQQEAQEQLVDLAEDIVYEALTDELDAGRRDTMARNVLSSLGRNRGYGQGAGNVQLNLPKGPVNISWQDGSSLSVTTGSEKVIDHE